MLNERRKRENFKQYTQFHLSQKAFPPSSIIFVSSKSVEHSAKGRKINKIKNKKRQ